MRLPAAAPSSSACRSAGMSRWSWPRADPERGRGSHRSAARPRNRGRACRSCREPSPRSSRSGSRSERPRQATRTLAGTLPLPSLQATRGVRWLRLDPGVQALLEIVGRRFRAPSPSYPGPVALRERRARSRLQARHERRVPRTPHRGRRCRCSRTPVTSATSRTPSGSTGSSGGWPIPSSGGSTSRPDAASVPRRRSFDPRRVADYTPRALRRIMAGGGRIVPRAASRTSRAPQAEGR